MCSGQFHSIGEGHEQNGSDSQQKETSDEGKTVQYALSNCDTVTEPLLEMLVHLKKKKENKQSMIYVELLRNKEYKRSGI